MIFPAKKIRDRERKTEKEKEQENLFFILLLFVSEVKYILSDKQYNK